MGVVSFDRRLQLKARIAGFLYLLVFGSAFAEITRASLIVRTDAALTAANITASEALFRIAFAADLVSALSYVGVSGLLYILLRPVSRDMSLLAALFGLAGSVIMATNLTNLVGALNYLRPGNGLTVFSTDQLQALTLAALRFHGLGFVIAMLFFGVYCLLLGWLIRWSTFLPRILGVALMITGVCYVLNSMLIFLAPEVARGLSSYLLAPGLIAEGGLTLWLLVRGVDVARWNESARIADTH